MTYGIRLGESVLITAPEGVGKTEICHAIEYQILTNTEDNVGAIYIEEPRNVIFKLWRACSSNAPFISLTQVLATAEFLKALQEVLRKDDRLHLYSHFGSDDPETILDPSASWYLLAAVSILFLTICLWLLAVLGVKLPQTPSPTSRRAPRSPRQRALLRLDHGLPCQ